MTLRFQIYPKTNSKKTHDKTVEVMHLRRNKISDEKEIKRKRRRVRDEREWSRVNKPKCLPLQSAGDSIYVTYDYSPCEYIWECVAHTIYCFRRERKWREKKKVLVCSAWSVAVASNFVRDSESTASTCRASYVHVYIFATIGIYGIVNGAHKLKFRATEQERYKIFRLIEKMRFFYKIINNRFIIQYLNNILKSRV